MPPALQAPMTAAGASSLDSRSPSGRRARGGLARRGPRAPWGWPAAADAGPADVPRLRPGPRRVNRRDAAGAGSPPGHRRAHYVRPLARDAHGHSQRLDPAVLATWDERLEPVRALRLGRPARDRRATRPSRGGPRGRPPPPPRRPRGPGQGWRHQARARCSGSWPAIGSDTARAHGDKHGHADGTAGWRARHAATASAEQGRSHSRTEIRLLLPGSCRGVGRQGWRRSAVNLFPWFLFAHVLGAIIAFGPTFSSPIIGRHGRRGARRTQTSRCG